MAVQRKMKVELLSRVEKSVVEKSNEVNPGTKTQIANIPSENVELAASFQ